jgi:Zn-dependent peptidase ImmA (M78 family)
MEWIDQLIVGLFDIYNTNDPYDILDEMEVEVIKVEKSNPILLRKNCTYVIELNKIFIRDDLILNYELFYLRHELGHILMHIDVSNMFIINDGKIEREANYFALELSKISFDEIELYQMTLEQICCSLELPYNAVNQLVNL